MTASLAAAPAVSVDHVDALPVGARLGEFEILALLGVGGFGMVYKAFDHSLHRHVAIKEYMPAALAARAQGQQLSVRTSTDLQTFQAGLASFVEEARLLAQFDHPSLVKVFRFWEANNTAYMVMPLYQGMTLKQARAFMRKPPPEAWLRKLLWAVLDALRVLHENDTLHRDISPDNILVDKTGNPILIDFGAASEQVVRATRVLTGRRVIKEGYSPQEFYLTGAEQSPASDLYSLGATFYHVITGSPPPESQRRLARVAEGEPDPYQPLAGRFDGYPPGFLEAIDKAVRVMPKDRIQSAGDWLDWIRIGEEGGPLPAALTEEPPKLKTRPVTRPTSVPVGFLQDNMGYVIGAGAVFVVAGIAVLWSLLT